MREAELLPRSCEGRKEGRVNGNLKENSRPVALCLSLPGFTPSPLCCRSRLRFAMRIYKQNQQEVQRFFSSFAVRVDARNPVLAVSICKCPKRVHNSSVQRLDQLFKTSLPSKTKGTHNVGVIQPSIYFLKPCQVRCKLLLGTSRSNVVTLALRARGALRLQSVEPLLIPAVTHSLFHPDTHRATRRRLCRRTATLPYLFTLALVPVLLLVDRTLEQGIDVKVSVRHLESKVSSFYIMIKLSSSHQSSRLF